MIDTAVILAGGKAKRLKNITKNIPKSLLMFKNRPFLYYQLNLLKRNDIKKVIICTGHHSEQIENYIKKFKFNLNIFISKDGNFPLGTGGALLKAMKRIKKNFFLIYGDSYLPINFQKLSKCFKKNPSDIMLSVYKNRNTLDKSNILIKNNYLLYKKGTKNKDYKYIDYGLSIFGKNCIKLFPKKQSFDLSDIFYSLSKKKLISYKIVNQRFYEIGSIKGIKDFKNYLNK
tara:strand:+ start:177 stop:866 length:690 start_codon:yes stop_codon:yes gene_type:complete